MKFIFLRNVPINVTGVRLMKMIIVLLVSLFQFSAYALKIEGNYQGSTCKTTQAMMWLSLDNDNYKERKLLLHTMVPNGGTFSFYVKPGNYQLRGSDEKGCEFLKKLSVKDSDQNIQVALKGEDK